MISVMVYALVIVTNYGHSLLLPERYPDRVACERAWLEADGPNRASHLCIPVPK